jgi:hypothetical protein
MTYKSCRGAAGGMDLPKAYTEGVDNSFDAGALVHISGLVTVKLPKQSSKEVDTQVFFELNDAAGLAAMPHLFGIADEAAVKMEKADAGIFNSGHTAATGFFDPKEAYSESAIDSTLYALTFKAADFVSDYEKYPDDMSKAKISTHMRVYDERLSSRQTLLEKILERISDPQVKEFFGKLVANQLPNYMLHVYILREEKQLDPDQFRQFMPALRMTYSEILSEGAYIIHVLDDSENPENNVIRYASENAIDPLWDTVKFPVLMANAEFRRNKTGLVAKITLYNEADMGVTKVFYAAPSNNGQRKGALEPSTEAPVGWDKIQPFIEVTYRMNIIGEAAAHDLYRALGGGNRHSDIQGIDDMRGILLKWAYRLLGKPYWKKGGKERLGFGDARNMKFARCVISAESCNADARQAKLDIVDSLKIQSNKHNCEMDTCDPMISFIHTILFGTLTHSYSHCNDGINRGPKGRTTPWKLDEFYRELIKNWGPPKEKKEMKRVAKAEANLVGPAMGGTTMPEMRASTTSATAIVETPQTRATVQAAMSQTQTKAPEAAPLVSNSKTLVAPHERGTSKAPRDIMAAAMDLRNWLENSTIDELVKEASSETVTGLQEIFKALENTKACLVSLGVKQR